jgi:hypothetical protein
MSTTKDDQPLKDGAKTTDDYGSASADAGAGSDVEDVQTYAYSDSRKLGVTGSVFLILNKMIGTGSRLYPKLFPFFIWSCVIKTVMANEDVG